MATKAKRPITSPLERRLLKRLQKKLREAEIEEGKGAVTLENEIIAAVLNRLEYVIEEMLRE